MEFSENQFRWAIVFAVALLGFAAYSTSFSGEFVWDDVSSIILHDHVRDPGKVLQLFREDQHAFGRGQGNFYRPLLSVSFMVDHIFAYAPADVELPPSSRPPELSAFFFHVTSTLWHIAAALLLFAVMTRLGATATVRALVVGAYVLHPLHTEAVAYISGRADSMAAAFMFAGIALSVGDPHSPRRGQSVILASWCFIFALLCKESALIYPALLFVCLYFGSPNRQSERTASFPQRFLPLFFAVPIAAVYVGLRATVLNFAPDSSTVQSTIVERLVESAQAFALYVGLIFAPLNLHMNRTLDDASRVTTLLGLVLILAAVALAAYGHQRGKPGVALGMGWFLVTWLPISGIFPLNAPMAEHWMYVPLAGFLWAMATLLSDKGLPKLVGKVSVAAAGVWCVWLLSLTAARNADWHDNEAIYTDTLRHSPLAIGVRSNLANTYEVLLDNPIGARREFQRVLRLYENVKDINPAAAKPWEIYALEARYSLARISMAEENLPAAANYYGELIQQMQDTGDTKYLVDALFGLGNVQMALGDDEAALQQFSRLLQMNPDFTSTILRLWAEGPDTGEP